MELLQVSSNNSIPT